MPAPSRIRITNSHQSPSKADDPYQRLDIHGRRYYWIPACGLAVYERRRFCRAKPLKSRTAAGMRTSCSMADFRGSRMVGVLAPVVMQAFISAGPPAGVFR